MAMKHYISSDPAILSGMPVITGTRVPIARILSLLKEGYTLAEIQEQFDHISLTFPLCCFDQISCFFPNRTT